MVLKCVEPSTASKKMVQPGRPGSPGSRTPLPLVSWNFVPASPPEKFVSNVPVPAAVKDLKKSPAPCCSPPPLSTESTELKESENPWLMVPLKLMKSEEKVTVSGGVPLAASDARKEAS